MWHQIKFTLPFHFVIPSKPSVQRIHPLTSYFSVLHQDPQSQARVTQLQLPHGEVLTPVFMPVGTFGTVRHVTHEDMETVGSSIILGNTYHLYLRPGPKLLSLESTSNYHNFIHWKKPILTDSGGFQIFSLPHQRQISEKGVRFKSYIDGSYHSFTPESNIAFQEHLGSDIMMVLDVCVPSTSEKHVCREAMERTHRWAKRALEAKTRTDTKLFGIVQGAIFEDLRRESAEYLTSLPFDGYALGGLAVGETDEERDHFTRFGASLLPYNSPRYLMGVGTPHDLVRGVEAGIDMFDCIIPTNHAKQGLAYTWKGKVKLRRLEHQKESQPLDPNCSCPVCLRYSRRYLYQLFKSGEPTSWRLISLHNLWFYEELTQRMRQHIQAGTFRAFAADFLREVPD